MLGRADPADLLSSQPWLAGMPYFAPYARGLAKEGFAQGGKIDGHRIHGKPLFTEEGPQFYQRAYDFFHKYAHRIGGSYFTGLHRDEEDAFEEWVKRYRVPFDVNAGVSDYDMRGFWKHTGGAPYAGHGAHFPDTFKTPYDTMFSRESRYATRDNPFDWVGNDLVNVHTGKLISAQARAQGGMIPGYATGGVVGAAEAAGSAAPKKGTGYNFINHPSNAQFDILQDKSLSSHQKAVALAYLAGHGSTVPKNFPKKGKKAPKTPPPKLHLYPTGGGFLGGGQGDDMDAIGSGVKWMNEMQNKTIPYLSGEYSFIQDQNSNTFGNSQFVVTQDAQGNPVTPFIDWATVNADLGQLQQMYGIESTIRVDYQQMNAVVAPLIKTIKQAIAKRRALIAKAKHQIAVNVRALKFLTKQLTLKGITNKQKGRRCTRRFRVSIRGTWCWAVTRAGLGTGGQIGMWSKQVGELNTDLGNSGEGVFAGWRQRVVWSVPVGSELCDWWRDANVGDVGRADRTVVPDRAREQSLAQAQGSAGTTDNSELLSLLQQQLSTSNEALFVSQQQYGVLQNLPPFGGSFAAGGMVPWSSRGSTHGHRSRRGVHQPSGRLAGTTHSRARRLRGPR